jgi:hypothetical protein
MAALRSRPRTSPHGVVHLPDARDADLIERAVVDHVLRHA